MELEWDRSPRLLAWILLRQDFAQFCRQASQLCLGRSRAFQAWAGIQLLTGSPGGDRPPTDPMPAGGESRHCSWPLQVTSEPPSWAYFPITTVLAVFQSVGRAEQPHLGLVYSPPQCPAPGTGGHYSISASYGQISPGPPSLSLELGFHGFFCLRQSLLAPCWLRGQGLAVGFLKYTGYCLFHPHPHHFSHCWLAGRGGIVSREPGPSRRHTGAY